MNRLIKKFPHLTETTIDTIRFVDTVYLSGYDTTIVNNIIRHDSVIVINNERVKVSYIYDTIKEKIVHTVTLPNDTIIETKEIQVVKEKVVYKELTWWEQYQTIIYVLLGLFVLLVVYKLLTK
tara:strand:- start:2239 stop:2607 length:369 start_codon:yes stop_codon:yes gene_type:complete